MKRFIMGLMGFLCMAMTAQAQEWWKSPSGNETPPDKPQAVMPLHMKVNPVGQCWEYTGGNVAFYGEIPAGTYLFVRLRTVMQTTNRKTNLPEGLYLPMDQNISFTTPEGGSIAPRAVLGGGNGTRWVPDGTIPRNWPDMGEETSDWGWHGYIVTQPVRYMLGYGQFPEDHDYGVAEFCVRDVPSLRGTVTPTTTWSSMGWITLGRNLL